MLNFLIKNKNFLKKTGYLKDQHGIINRYYREKENWDKHLEKCKNFISKELDNFSGKKIAVFGSGWLLDVPIELLVKKFKEVWLFDVKHPLVVKQKLKNHTNIKWVESDLTGGMIKKAVECKNIEEFAAHLQRVEILNFQENFDFVISINLLNQLDVLLCDFLKRKFKTNEYSFTAIRQKIQTNHVNFLLHYPKGILISDCAELIFNKKQIIEYKNLIHTDLSKFNEKENWEWIFDTHRLYYRKFEVNFSVKAFSF